MSGQNDLQSRDHDHHGDKDDPKESGAKKNIVNKFKLSVLSNAVCVDILVWATKDENGKIDSFHTVWKVQKFFAIQILRKINIGQF